MALTERRWTAAVPHVLWMKRECPRCTSIQFERAEARALDGAFGLAALRPVRCVNCFRRYYWFARAPLAN